MEGGSPSAPGALARVRVMLSRSVLAEPAPSAPLAGTSRLHRRAAYPRCLRCAGALRRPASGSGLSLPFRPDMPSSLTPGSSRIACVQLRDADAGLRRDPSGSALPTLPQSVSRGARLSRLHWFAFATACQVARPPGRIGPGFPGPPGTFTSRLPTGRSPFPPLDMTTTATGLLCWRDFHPQEWQLASLHRIGPGFPGPPGTFTSRLPAGRSPFPPLDMTTTATGLLCWRDFHPQEWQLASLHRIG